MSTSANSNKTVIRPQFKIETRVSFVADEQGVAVPLGYEMDGEWIPYKFMEDGESLPLSPEQIASWLAGPNSFECSFIQTKDEAMSAVQETIQRCQELAERAAKE